MPMNIRDPRAETLARELANLRNTTMTQVVIDALEGELKREREKKPLMELVEKLWEKHGITEIRGRDLTKDELDELWGM